MIAKLLANPGLIIGLARSVMILLVTFGVGIAAPQQAAILDAVGAFLSAASLIFTGMTAVVTTPKASPTLDSGTLVKVVTAEGLPNKTQVVL